MESVSRLSDNVSVEPRIAVLGVGGAGCNIVSELYESFSPVDTVAINTDKAALLASSADKKIYICREVTKGEGARGDARLGKKCARVHEEEIRAAISGHDVVFIVAGLGGGTGTGASAVIAEICNSMNVMTFAIVINPFSFEGSRVGVASEGVRSIDAVCKNVFKVENDLILNHYADMSMMQAFKIVNRSIGKYILDTVASIPVYLEVELKSVNKMIRNMPSDVKNLGEFRLNFGLNA